MLFSAVPVWADSEYPEPVGSPDLQRPVTSSVSSAVTGPAIAAAQGAVADSVSTIALLDGEILFGTGQYELTQEGRQALSDLIDRLERFERIISIRIIGHTDNLGAASVNQQLSEGRARWIQDQFIARYPEAHILAMGAGENAPVVSNASRAGRARNRRAEVQVIAVGKPPAAQ